MYKWGDLCETFYQTPTHEMITKFEADNNVTVNIYVLDSDDNARKYRTHDPNIITTNDKHFNLLLLKSGNKHHFVYITDLSMV